MRAVLIALALALGLPQNTQGSAVKEEQINACENDRDCIVVSYKHCCGSTKRAIHRKYKRLYEARREWQEFRDPETCQLMGRCAPDQDLKSAKCVGSSPKRCQLSR